MGKNGVAVEKTGWTRLTCRGPDGGRDGGGGHGGHTLIVLGVAGLDGAQVAVASRAEAAWQVQRLHGLRLNLTEDRLAHRFKLPIDLRLAHLDKRLQEQGESC